MAFVHLAADVIHSSGIRHSLRIQDLAVEEAEVDKAEEMRFHSAHIFHLQAARMCQTHIRQLCMVLCSAELSQSSHICQTGQLWDILEEVAAQADICCHMEEALLSAMEASASPGYDADGHDSSLEACIHSERLEGCHLCM